MNLSRPTPSSPTFLHARLWTLPLFILIILVATGCQPANNTTSSPMLDTASPKLTANDFSSLHQLRVFFMHQSVGKNLMDGVDFLARDAGIDISLVQREADSLAAGFADTGIIHTYGGKNRFPETKIDSFVEQLARFPQNGRPDVAMMKLCFIDFDTDTDINSLFARYTATLDALEKRYPDVTFVHMTVPLMEFPRTLKARIKRLLGMSVWVDVTNAKREAFSNRIRNRYPPNRVFDIARYESTLPNGRREMRTEGERTIYGLPAVYTNDGSHLNEHGKRFVARHFLAFLHGLAAKRAGEKTGDSRD